MQNLFSPKSSPQNLCSTTPTNGVIYEDLTNVRPRTISPHRLPDQTTLSPIEMIDIASYSDHATFSPVFICSTSPVRDSCISQELFNPTYEELSNESGGRDETDSEEMPQAGNSEDEFAEDELSLGREADICLDKEKKPRDSSLQEFMNSDISRDMDSSDVDDRCKFLDDFDKNSSLSFDYRERGKKTIRGSHFRGLVRRPKSSEKKKIWKNEMPPLPAPSVNGKEIQEGFLLKKILHIYPNFTGMDLQYSHRSPPTSQRLENPFSKGSCENFATFNDAHWYVESNHSKQEIFQTLGPVQSYLKNQNLYSSLGSDSGFSNNTFGGLSSIVRKDYSVSKYSDSALS